MNDIHWEHVITDAGHHLRLRAANGEPVLTSEVLTGRDAVLSAWAVARRSFMNEFAYAEPELVDERTKDADHDH